jgi:hypothetical protein
MSESRTFVCLSLTYPPHLFLRFLPVCNYMIHDFRVNDFIFPTFTSVALAGLNHLLYWSLMLYQLCHRCCPSCLKVSAPKNQIFVSTFSILKLCLIKKNLSKLNFSLNFE